MEKKRDSHYNVFVQERMRNTKYCCREKKDKQKFVYKMINEA